MLYTITLDGKKELSHVPEKEIFFCRQVKQLTEEFFRGQDLYREAVVKVVLESGDMTRKDMNRFMKRLRTFNAKNERFMRILMQKRKHCAFNPLSEITRIAPEN